MGIGNAGNKRAAEVSPGQSITSHKTANGRAPKNTLKKSYEKKHDIRKIIT
jgi:hypothetical protein